MAKKKFRKGQISAKAVVNEIKVNSLPSSVFANTTGGEIVPYGLDNIYPQRIFDAISKSPTAKGCVKRLREFVFGLGTEGGAEIVNREGETLNDVLSGAIDSYSKYFGFALHFNFNIFGQITEMSVVDLRFIRKTADLKTAIIGEWGLNTFAAFQDIMIEVDLYNPETLEERITLAGGIEKYKGQLLYFSADQQIYPTALIDSASTSANYEFESQIYTFANIKNGFSGNTIIKFPGMELGEQSQEERGSDFDVNRIDQTQNTDDEEQSGISKLQEELEAMHGSESAGSTLVVQVPVGVNGEFKDFKMVENLTPTNVDALFVNQNEKAENNILKVYTTPMILLGVASDGMFNQESFNDAFNYKNADTEGDRVVIERVFNLFLPQSVFLQKEIDIIPLQMRGEGEITIETTTKEGETVQVTSDVSPEQAAAQAQLKGSVGGVNGILDIQKGFSSGITSFQSAIGILELVYGFSREESLKLLGNPKEE